MQRLRVTDGSPTIEQQPRFAVLALGFRPFFLLAALGAIALVTAWTLLWHRGLVPEAYYGRIGWHSHEMLFGYAVAVVAGFLLTAVRNWTGIETPVGAPLGGLALLWLAARVLPWFPDTPPLLIAAADLAFLPLLALGLARPLWEGRNKVNRVFLPLLLAMTGANALIHSDALGLTVNLAGTGSYLMLDLLLILVLLVAGRVMPFFTERAVPGAKAVIRPWVERLTFVLALALAGARLGAAAAPVVSALAFGLALVQAARIAGWYHRGIWGIPILWVLYTALGWLVLGLGLEAAAGWGLAAPNLALHALTVGSIGTLTLGMMARVTLGHTGREMCAAPAVTAAFVLVNLAAAARVLGPMVWPRVYPGWVLISGICWILAFTLFVFIHGPMLVRPRVDGRPG